MRCVLEHHRPRSGQDRPDCRLDTGSVVYFPSSCQQHGGVDPEVLEFGGLRALGDDGLRFREMSRTERQDVEPIRIQFAAAGLPFYEAPLPRVVGREQDRYRVEQLPRTHRAEAAVGIEQGECLDATAVAQ